ncbi:polyamine aminopropyltransferase [Vibrio phage V-YDF132]|nr:polyamine aminopropyltransferase [Vibrio phage V-YDF132]
MNDLMSSISKVLLAEKLPLPEMKVPEYTTGEFGEWIVSRTEVPEGVHGYFSGGAGQADTTYVLLRKTEGSDRPVVWMSFTAMELESHALHVKRAEGHVVVCGLGMGMYLYNILSKPEVTKVTVLELDASIITLFKQVSGYENWEGVEKLEIIHSDALVPTPEALEKAKGCDYLYADIWELVASDRAQGEMQVICEWAKPKGAGHWCCEIDYLLHCANRGVNYAMVKSGDFDAALLEVYRKDTGIPLDLNKVCGSKNGLCAYGYYVSQAGMAMLSALRGR